MLYFVYMHYPISFPITCDKKLPPQTISFIESWVHTQDFPPIRSCASPLPIWKVWSQTGSTPYLHILSATSRMCPKCFLLSMHLVMRLRGTIITFSPSRWGRATTSNSTSATSKANSPKVPNYGEDVSSGLQVSYPLYKHLLKQSVTQMSDVLSRVQTYI